MSSRKRASPDASIASKLWPSMPRGSTVSFGNPVRFLEGLPLRHLHEEPPEAMRFLRLRLPINASPQFLQIEPPILQLKPQLRWVNRRLCHLAPASL